MKHWLWFLCALSAAANAQMFRCTGTDGKIQFADRPCLGSAEVSVVKEHNTRISQQDQYSARMRTARMQDELRQQESDRSTAIARYNAEQRRQATSPTKSIADTPSTSDADAVTACIKDVERRGASQNTKAELIAACRTSGASQRNSGISGELVNDCIKGVERTASSEQTKSREIARCHGADVQPEPVAIAKPRPLVITSCDQGGCFDDAGHHYMKSGSFLYRDDGKTCMQTGNMISCQ